VGVEVQGWGRSGRRSSLLLACTFSVTVHQLGVDWQVTLVDNLGREIWERGSLNLVAEMCTQSLPWSNSHFQHPQNSGIQNSIIKSTLKERD
jgi:hypothetical protein